MTRPKSDLPAMKTTVIRKLPNVNTQASRLENHLQSAIMSIHKIANNVRQEEEIMQSENDWKFVAMVIDRCFLWIFVLVCIVGTMTLFVQPLVKTNYE